MIVLDSAAEDLQAGREFYDSCEFGAGNYFIDCLMSDISSLRFYSGTHRKYWGLFKLNSQRFPFAIYYDIKDDIVRVAAILDMRKNPRAIREILSSRKRRQNKDNDDIQH